MLIRDIYINDREHILSFVNRTSIFSEEEKVVAMELVDIVLNNKNQQDYLLKVAELNNQVIGYYCIGKRALTNGVFDLYWIVVDPNTANTGVGTKLLQNAEEEIKSKNGNLIWVETSSRKDYDLTRNFYLKNNYKVLAIINNFYKENDSLVIFGKYISNK